MSGNKPPLYCDFAHLEKLRRQMPELLKTARAMRGFLSEREMKFLAMAAACAVADGVILEIGSFLGKSTSILAMAGRLAPGTEVVAVDPLDYRPSFDPKRGKESCLDDFKANLAHAQVEQLVEFHQMRSQELAPLWKRDRKIRFLWIDGDHSHEGVKGDFDLFSPLLADGAIVALHDCFKHDVGPMRVLAEDDAALEKIWRGGRVRFHRLGAIPRQPQQLRAVHESEAAILQARRAADSLRVS